ncbi:MAG: hypothetical protein JOZ69_24475 [Myxococcales bacterium]|nr:hypothetical protein [Myxococcales bacterium]
MRAVADAMVSSGMKDASGSGPVRTLKLRVTNDQDGSGEDRADWAEAQVVCQP